MNQFKLGIDTVKSYVDNRITLKKLEGLEAVGKLAANVVFFALIAVFSLFLIIFLSLGGAFYIGDAMSFGNGFMIVAGIYLFLIILLVILKKTLQKAVINMIISASSINKNEE